MQEYILALKLLLRGSAKLAMRVVESSPVRLLWSRLNGMALTGAVEFFPQPVAPTPSRCSVAKKSNRSWFTRMKSGDEIPHLMPVIRAMML